MSRPSACVAENEPTDRILYQSSRLTIANFRVAPPSPRFRRPDPISNQIVVFPRAAVRLAPASEGTTEEVVDPTVVTLYRQGQSYRRRPIDESPDRCDWFSLPPEAFRELLGGHMESTFDRFVLSCPISVYTAQRRIVRYLEETPSSQVDPREVEEATLATLRRLFAGAISGRAEVAAGAAWLVRKAKGRLAEATAPRGLEELALELGCSVGYLCRAFRSVTGETLHAWRTRRRLALALEALETSSLSGVALDHGFSSHSHFTEVFHRWVGTTPSAYRQSVTRLPRLQGAAVL